MEKQKVGIIGVGLMGHGIAMNIAKKGWTVGYLDHPGNQPADDLKALGATSFADKHDLAGASDVLILCVNGTPQVEEILLGETGILAKLRTGTIIIDCSTAVPSSTEAIAKIAEAAGGRFLDAAMTRTPLEAAQGRLNLLVGSDEALFAEVRPLLESFSENIFHAGAVGAGHKLKLLHNFVSLGTATLLSEAAACALQGGISPELFVDVLAKGGGYGAALDRVSPFLLSGDTSKMKFTVANAQKDLAYYAKMATDLHAQDNMARGTLAAIDSLVAQGLSTNYMAEATAGFRSIGS